MIFVILVINSTREKFLFVYIFLYILILFFDHNLKKNKQVKCWLSFKIYILLHINIWNLIYQFLFSHEKKYQIINKIYIFVQKFFRKKHKKQT